MPSSTEVLLSFECRSVAYVDVRAVAGEPLGVLREALERSRTKMLPAKVQLTSGNGDETEVFMTVDGIEARLRVQATASAESRRWIEKSADASFAASVGLQDDGTKLATGNT